MMRLSLMRHANSQLNPTSDDFERKLSTQGEKEATISGTFLSEYNIDRAIVSYAKRTLQTFELIQKQTGQIPAEITQELYKHHNPDIIYNLVETQTANDQHILVIGHNPLIYDIALMLSNNNSDYYDFLIETMMPTARIITLEFPQMQYWQELMPGQGNITKIFTPDLAAHSKCRAEEKS